MKTSSHYHTVEKSCLSDYNNHNNRNKELPFRTAEFASACVERSLEGVQPPVVYYGIMRAADHEGIVSKLESQAYRHWDSLATSPAKQRPRAAEDLSVSGLKLLSCSASGPGWPEHIMQKFPEGSTERTRLQEMKAAFETEFPPVGDGAATQSVTRTGVARVSGRPDYSLDDGKQPLDPERPVDLQIQSPPEVAQRWGKLLLNG